MKSQGIKFWLSPISNIRQFELWLLIQKIGQAFDIWLGFPIPRMLS